MKKSEKQTILNCYSVPWASEKHYQSTYTQIFGVVRWVSSYRAGIPWKRFRPRFRPRTKRTKRLRVKSFFLIDCDRPSHNKPPLTPRPTHAPHTSKVYTAVYTRACTCFQQHGKCATLLADKKTLTSLVIPMYHVCRAVFASAIYRRAPR